MNLFEKMILELKKEVSLSDDAEEMKTLVKRHLKYDDIHFKPMSGVQLKLLVPNNEREQVMDKLKEIPEFEYDPDIEGSLGGVRFKKARMLVKPIGGQGRSSAGVKNEDELEKYVNMYASEDRPISVKFMSKKGMEKISKVIGAKGVGSGQAKKYKKTDIVLERDKLPDYNISVKQTNADFWESSDTKMREIVLTLIKEIENGEHPEIYFVPYINKLGSEKKGIYSMMSSKTGEKVASVVDKIEDESDAKYFIFADDEVDAVIVATYKESDFEFNEEKNELEVKIKTIMTDLEDVKAENSWPWLKVRQGSDRRLTKGLRPMIHTEKSLYRKDGKLIGTTMMLK